MTVPQAQRLAYLQEMGIQAYFPRRALPGAKPSLQYSVQSISQASRALKQMPRSVGELAVKEASAQNADQASISHNVKAPTHAEAGTQATSALTAGLEQAKALLEQSLGAGKSREPARRSGADAELAPQAGPAHQQVIAEPAEPAAPVLESEEQVNFVFAYFPVNEDIAVINELPWAGNGQVSPEHKVLLAKILNALSVPCTAQSLEAIVFRWPIDGMPAGSQSARNMLEGFIARRLKIRPTRKVLVLAEQSSQYLFPLDHSMSPDARGFVTHPRMNCELVLTHSLDAMAASRQVKGVVWSALQPLKGLLGASAQAPLDDTRGV